MTSAAELFQLRPRVIDETQVRILHDGPNRVRALIEYTGKDRNGVGTTRFELLSVVGPSTLNMPRISWIPYANGTDHVTITWAKLRWIIEPIVFNL